MKKIILIPKIVSFNTRVIFVDRKTVGNHLITQSANSGTERLNITDSERG